MDKLGEQGANLTLCTTQVGYRFDCLAMTLEQMFKDCKSNPDPTTGYSPRRAKQMGRDLVTAIARALPGLR